MFRLSLDATHEPVYTKKDKPSKLQLNSMTLATKGENTKRGWMRQTTLEDATLETIVNRYGETITVKSKQQQKRTRVIQYTNATITIISL